MVSSVYFFIPNLIGYLRIISTAAAFYICFRDHQLAAVLYLIGQGLDAVDGTAARYFGQTSKLGAVLDMLTDRMSTAGLLVVLTHLYPKAWGFFTGVLILDITSHWFQVVSKHLGGAKSHKGSENPILNFYYTFPNALLVFCVGHEFYLVCLYMLAFPNTAFVTQIVEAVAKVCVFIFAGKTFMHFVQLYDSVKAIVALDDKDRAAAAVTKGK